MTMKTFLPKNLTFLPNKPRERSEITQITLRQLSEEEMQLITGGGHTGRLTGGHTLVPLIKFHG